MGRGLFLSNVGTHGIKETNVGTHGSCVRKIRRICITQNAEGGPVRPKKLSKDETKLAI